MLSVNFYVLVGLECDKMQSDIESSDIIYIAPSYRHLMEFCLTFSKDQKILFLLKYGDLIINWKERNV